MRLHPGQFEVHILFDLSLATARRSLAVLALILYPAATFALQPGKDEAKSNTKLLQNNSSNSELSTATAESVSESEPVLSDQERESSIQNLRRRNLLFPIEGVQPSTIKGSFYEMHGGAMHCASDILAPRNTPIQALEDGTIVKLFLSKPGGLTIYQTDLSGEYVYYYAHLEKYAPDLKQGEKVKRGQVIGYVGTSGNAPKNTPHLHLSISVLGPEKHWWVAAPIDPYDVFNK
jgi:murein DD-endopeptidase MepM/ murein hydrolase activator NlpD